MSRIGAIRVGGAIERVAVELWPCGLIRLLRCHAFAGHATIGVIGVYPLHAETACKPGHKHCAAMWHKHRIYRVDAVRASGVYDYRRGAIINLALECHPLGYLIAVKLQDTRNDMSPGTTGHPSPCRDAAVYDNIYFYNIVIHNA